MRASASPRRSVRDQLFLTASLPCAAWCKARSVWMLLMFLTVLCVAVQILGVVWQSRNDKLQSEKLLNVRFTIDIQRTPPTEQSQQPIRTEEGGAPRRGPAMAAEHRPIRDEHLERRDHQRGSHFESSDPFWPGGLNETVDSGSERERNQLTRNRQGLGHARPSVLPPEEVMNHMMNQRNSHLKMASSSSQPHRPPWSYAAEPQDSANEGRSLKGPAPSGPAPRGVHSNRDNAPPAQTCRPKTHIVFLKTHKTASSTVLNILYRYGDRRNLTFALPLNMHSQLFYPYAFAAYFVEGVRSGGAGQFHILCNHMRLRVAEVQKVMPQDSFYFSILRNPVAMMESIFSYYKSIPAFHRARSLDHFLDDGWRGYNASLTNNHYARNVLAFDFGLDNNVAADDPDFDTKVAAAIGAIERDFSLVLIAEYFDESMVLLRRALCWSLDDVVSFKLNGRSERTRGRALSPSTAAKIRAWNALDWRLYRHFNATFWRRVDATVGRGEMKQEVARLRERRAQLAQTCIQDGGAVEPSQVREAGLKPFQYGAAVIEGYNLKPGLDEATRARCRSLVTPELQYTEALYAKQFPDLAAKHRQAAKMAAAATASQRQTASKRAAAAAAALTGPVRGGGREARHGRTRRSGRRNNPNVLDRNAPPSALFKRGGPRSDRELP